MSVASNDRGLSVKYANRLALIGILAISSFPLLLGFLPVPNTWRVIFGYAIMVLLALYFCKKDGVNLFKAFDFHKVKPLTLLLTALIFVAIQPLTALVYGITNMLFPSLLDMVKQDIYGGNLFVNLVGIALIPGFFEEFLVRGTLVGSYRRTGRLRAAILLSALIFGLMHGNATQFFYAAVAGIVLAFLYILSGSIWPGVFLHFLNNGSSVVEEYLKLHFGEEVSARVFYIANMPVSLKAAIYSVIGVVIIAICLRAVAKMEGNEDLTAPCVKGGGGKAKLVTPALIVLIVVLVLLSALMTLAVYLQANGMIPENA